MLLMTLVLVWLTTVALAKSASEDANKQANRRSESVLSSICTRKHTLTSGDVPLQPPRVSVNKSNNLDDSSNREVK